ncbi:MAG: hypothetical protein ACRCZF_24235 [Gemmataceae bacterium]
MKRTAGTLVLIAGLGGCASTEGTTAMSNTSTRAAKPFGMPYTGVEVPGVVGPTGEPIHMTAPTARGAAPSGKAEKVQKTDSGVQQAAGFVKLGSGSGGGCADGNCGPIHTPGIMHGHGHHGTVDPYAYGPMGSQLGTLMGRNGIMPVPQMGPAGAVAAIGAIGAGGPMGPVVTNQRTSIKFTNPAGMKVRWLGPTGYTEPPLSTPANYNFLQGNVYRLKLSDIPTRGGKTYYPTLELRGATPKTITYLAHNTVPIGFTDEDFERVNAGNLVVKVIYLPDPQFQDLAAIAGAEEVVSTQLQLGEDPEVEASRRGTILAVIRLGNIDLENPFSPPMDAPMGGGARPMMAAPMMAAPMAGPGASLPPAMMPMATPTMPTMVMPPAATTPIATPPVAPTTLPPIKATPTSNKK